MPRAARRVGRSAARAVQYALRDAVVAQKEFKEPAGSRRMLRREADAKENAAVGGVVRLAPLLLAATARVSEAREQLTRALHAVQKSGSDGDKDAAAAALRELHGRQVIWQAACDDAAAGAAAVAAAASGAPAAASRGGGEAAAYEERGGDRAAHAGGARAGGAAEAATPPPGDLPSEAPVAMTHAQALSLSLPPSEDAGWSVPLDAAAAASTTVSPGPRARALEGTPWRRRCGGTWWCRRRIARSSGS